MVALDLILESGRHPLGILPLGNMYAHTEHAAFRDTRKLGLGNFSAFSDEFLCGVFFELDAIDLAHIALVSKAFYCWSMYDEYWKHHTLRQYPDFVWHGRSWRETFFANCQKREKRVSQMSLIQVPFMYSDFLFQSHYCSSAGIAREWLKVDNIERRNGLSLEEFVEKYEKPNRPVVITDIVPKWNAYKTWTKQSLTEKYGDVIFRAEAIDIKLENYFEYADSVLEETPFYLFDKFFVKNCPEMANDYSVPEYFSEDLFSLLGEEQRPDYRWLIIGPAKSGSSFHKDPNATSAWNATIFGSKKWILFPPDVVPPGVHPSADGSEVTTPVSLMEWFLNFYRDSKKTGHAIECITRAGDLMFVPSGWWHTVINLELSAAITQNYVSRRNIARVMPFLKNKKDQISGVDCSKAESLAARFGTAFEDAYPGELENLLATSNSKRRAEEIENASKKNSFWTDLRSKEEVRAEFSMSSLFSFER